MYIHRDHEKLRGSDSDVNKRYKQTFFGSCKAERRGNTLGSVEEAAASVSADHLSEERASTCSRASELVRI